MGQLFYNVLFTPFCLEDAAQSPASWLQRVNGS